jgi:hypothetical protein
VQAASALVHRLYHHLVCVRTEGVCATRKALRKVCVRERACAESACVLKCAREGQHSVCDKRNHEHTVRTFNNSRAKPWKCHIKRSHQKDMLRVMSTAPVVTNSRRERAVLIETEGIQRTRRSLQISLPKFNITSPDNRMQLKHIWGSEQRNHENIIRQAEILLWLIQ